LITLDNSYSAWMWAARGTDQNADQFDSLHLRTGWLFLLFSPGAF
jgi:hypothetical protein